ncbi:unnamed protein product [Callosobruchus maculatus]|uniref:Uncharacterized protein n=1 Tax=Callosobruchus maculatus TaxID=64391 RepID=A0A653C8W7_CALMS|nr:unnamed protein product [Callosobruchus maculatus]
MHQACPNAQLATSGVSMSIQLMFPPSVAPPETLTNIRYTKRSLSV